MGDDQGNTENTTGCYVAEGPGTAGGKSEAGTES